MKSRLFDNELARRGFRSLLPGDNALRDWVLPAIEQVKAGRAAEGGQQVAESKFDA